jgi:hypothetical protein
MVGNAPPQDYIVSVTRSSLGLLWTRLSRAARPRLGVPSGVRSRRQAAWLAADGIEHISEGRPPDLVSADYDDSRRPRHAAAAIPLTVPDTGIVATLLSLLVQIIVRLVRISGW